MAGHGPAPSVAVPGPSAAFILRDTLVPTPPPPHAADVHSQSDYSSTDSSGVKILQYAGAAAKRKAWP